MEVTAAVQGLGQAAEQWREVFATLQHQMAHGGPRAGGAGGLPHALHGQQAGAQQCGAPALDQRESNDDADRQAKRFTSPGGVGAVRDLDGTVLNEGSTKGSLLTTSDDGSS